MIVDRSLKSTILGESQTVTWLVPVRTLMPLRLLIEPFTCDRLRAGGRRPVGRIDARAAAAARASRPTRK